MIYLLEAMSKMEIDYILNNYHFEIIVGLVGLVVIGYILILIQSIKIGNIRRKYYDLFQDVNVSNIEEMLLNNKKEIESIKNINTGINIELTDINSDLRNAYTKSAIEKYNAFEGMGGQLSFVLVMLDKRNNGIMVNSIYSNEGNYLYLKEIVEGECEKELSKEEKMTLEKTL